MVKLNIDEENPQALLGRIIRIIDLLKLTDRDFEIKVGLPQSTVAQYRTRLTKLEKDPNAGKGSISSVALARIVLNTNVSADWLLTGRGQVFGNLKEFSNEHVAVFRLLAEKISQMTNISGEVVSLINVFPQEFNSERTSPKRISPKRINRKSK
jgi:hypothetical protein